MKVTKVVNSIFSSNTYILEDDSSFDVWLVDCGDIDNIISFLPSKKVKGVLLTHTHFDHIYGLNGLFAIYPDCCVFTNIYGREGLLSAKKNMSFFHEKPFIFNKKEKIFVVEDGMEINIGFTSAKVFFTPGHSESCISYIVNDYLFSGDSYIPGIKVVTNLPGSNKSEAVSSAKLIESMALNKVLCSGHGEITKI